jgi:hypothetical protein
LEIILYILRSWEKDTTMPHARARRRRHRPGRPVAVGVGVARQAGGSVRACHDGNKKGFAIHQLWEFTSILMVHYPVSAQAL